MGDDRTGLGGGRKNRRFKKALMVDTVRGSLRVRNWPRPRPTRSDIQRDREKKFGDVQRLWRVTAPELQKVFTESAKGSPFLPRDLYTAAMYGRLFQLQFEGTGRVMSSMAQRKDVSESLDTLGSVSGMALVRGAELWEAADPAPDGYVLASNGPGAAPSFRNVAAATGQRIYSPAGLGELNTFARATRGNVIFVEEEITIYSLRPMIDAAAAGVNYVGYVVFIGVSWLVTAVAKSTIYTTPAAGPQTLKLDLALPPIIPQGALIGLLVGVTGPTGTTPARLWAHIAAASNNPTLPAFASRRAGGVVEQAANDINPGDTLTVILEDHWFSIGIIHSYGA